MELNLVLNLSAQRFVCQPCCSAVKFEPFTNILMQFEIKVPSSKWGQTKKAYICN